MLALKGITSKKIGVYIVVLVLVAASAGYVLYQNLFANRKPSAPLSAGQNSFSSANIAGGTKDLTGSQAGENELDFMASSKWQNLRSNTEAIELKGAGNKNPFLVNELSQ